MKKDVLIYFDLITSLRTTQEVASFVSEIDTLALIFFKSEKVSMEKALNSISTDSAKKIMQVFSKNSLDINDRDVVADFFDILKKLMKKFKVIKLILAFDPTRKTIENIHNFVKDIAGIGYILDIEVEADLLGGAVVIFDGKYYDFTLKKRIEESFRDKREGIVRFLNS
jgi:F0F1-type ATP synthase delta subunit